MALSFALHGLALVPLLLAGLSAGGAPADEIAFLVEFSLAAPAPAARADPAAPEPASHPESQAVDAASEPVPEPETVAQEPPPPPEPQRAPEPEIAVELPPPDEPPPLSITELKPVEPPKPQPKSRPQPQARPASTLTPARASPVTQTASAPNSGDAQSSQSMAAAQQPLIVFEGKPRFRVPPRPAVYPPRAIELGQQGEALVRVRLDPDGSAAEIVLWRGSGFDLLDRAAINAVRGWHFLPAMRGGQAVAAWVEIPVRFHLH